MSAATEEKIAKLRVVCGDTSKAVRILGEVAEREATSIRKFSDILDEQIRKAARDEE